MTASQCLPQIHAILLFYDQVGLMRQIGLSEVDPDSAGLPHDTACKPYTPKGSFQNAEK
jgi:hypothetical protein